MERFVFATTTVPIELMPTIKAVVAIGLLAGLWALESVHPFFGQREGRWRHAGHNLTIAFFNTVVLALLFGSLTVFVAERSQSGRYGLLNALTLSGPWRFLGALLLLDAWMYAWHRANHAIPLLWRFHRMHHSDPHMDVTTATRFHLGEHTGASVLRLCLIPLAGFEVAHLVVYDILVIAITQFHHADISIGWADDWLRWLIVTPFMHKVHHSNWQPETDSNYSTVLSVWDRLAGSYRMRSDPATLTYGLEGFGSRSWQTWWGMLKTPFVNRRGDV